MRVLIDIGHPAHVHLFKYIIRNLEKNEHEVKICVRERGGIVGKLLEHYNFQYENLSKNVSGLFNKAITMVKNDYKLLKISNKFNPDIFLSVVSPYSAQVSKLKHKKYIAFTDSEPTRLILSLTLPFTDVIITPSGFKKDLGKKQIRVNSYKELAYLHPNYFKPKSGILKEIGVKRNEDFFILRFVAWQASHDIGQKGLDLEAKRKLIRLLSKHGKIFISSEKGLPKEFEKYRFNLPPEKIHDALYYAKMFIGDSQTMTTEAAILGTPAIRCNSFVGPNDMGNFIELEKKYDLIYSFRDFDKAYNKVKELLNRKNLKKEWQKKRKILLRDKIDFTKWMVDFVESFNDK